MLLTNRQVADVLHDDAAQYLYASRLALEQLLDSAALDEGGRHLATRALGLVTRGEAAVRDVIHGDAPGGRTCSPALDVDRVLDRAEEAFSVTTRRSIDDEARRSLAGSLPLSELYARAAGEAVTNAVKHAGPCAIAVDLRVARGGLVVLTVSDDGTGRVSRPRPGTHGGHGLPALRARARSLGACLRVRHGERGTSVKLTAPIR